MTALAEIEPGADLSGFRMHAHYVDSDERVVGASLQHTHTGMALEVLTSETVPQAYIWVDTEPVSDRGEPHTQEHLLLGKGQVGRASALLEDMALVSSSAFTAKLRTAYHLSSPAGLDSFLAVLEARLNALLHPDYSDEEIRREVHHLGVATDADGALRLEEKGTIYAEMVSSMQRPGSRLWRRALVSLYGRGHPESWASGGVPEAIRELRPEHIRSFHERCYRLAAMGTILVLRPSEDPGSALARLDGALHRLQPEPTPSDPPRSPPAPDPDDARDLIEVEWPERDPDASTQILLSWPPERAVSSGERILLQLLLQGLAGAEDTPLYRALVDSTHRERDLGATSVSAWVSRRQGQPVHASISGIPASRLDPETIDWVRNRVVTELERVASMAPGSADLQALQARLQRLWTARRRRTRSWLASPPRFGVRGVYTAWHDHLEDLRVDGGTVRRLDQGPALQWAGDQLARQDGLWADWLKRWGLVGTTPMAHVTRPRPELLATATADREERLAGHLRDLGQAEGVAPQEALSRLKARSDQATAELEAADVGVQPRMVDDPPLTPDDAIEAQQRTIGGVPYVACRFHTMPGATLGISLTLDGVGAAHEDLIAAFPDLLSEVGVVVDGRRVPYTKVLDTLRRDVLSVSATLSANCNTSRAELALTGAGTDAQETNAALIWMGRFLTAPDWSVANLPRIRDVVDERLEILVHRMRGREEHWARSVADAWIHQTDRIQLRTWCFLTRMFDVQRLRWRLMAPDSGADAALARLRSTPERSVLTAALDELREAGGTLREVASDLQRLAADIPDPALPRDWPALCDRARIDLATLPERALEALDTLRVDVVRRGGARLWAAGGAVLDGLDADLERLLQTLPPAEVPEVTRAFVPEIRARMANRGADANATHVGLLDPNLQTGIAMFSVPHTTYADVDDEDALVDLLAARVFGGGGPHGLFMRTWAAGLAYSNGTSASPARGRFSWYAERCPEIVRTAGFAVDQLRAGLPDTDVAEYALALLFWSRAGGGYGGRAAALAADLIDDRGPVEVAAFRRALLRLRKDPRLATRVASRVLGVHERLFPGLGETDADATSVVIGDARQLDGWADWLKRNEGAELVRIHPRDFWLGL